MDEPRPQWLSPAPDRPPVPPLSLSQLGQRFYVSLIIQTLSSFLSCAAVSVHVRWTRPCPEDGCCIFESSPLPKSPESHLVSMVTLHSTLETGLIFCFLTSQF